MTDLATIQELSAAGRHQECLQACQNALQANQEETYAYKYAGKSLLALGQFEKAQQCLVKAHQLDSSDPEIVKDIGNIFLNLGNTDTALGWYEKALEINNNYAPAINNLANLKRQSGNLQEAINLFKRAIKADPSLIQAYVGSAASFLTLGDLDQAESFAAQALAINKSAPGVNETLGIVFQNKSKPDQAIKCYQKELEVNYQASNSLLNLGLLLLQKGQTAAAVDSLSKASTLAPSEQCSLLLAQAYQNLGQFKEAIVEYKKVDIDQAKNKMIPFNLGLCLLNTGNNIDAIDAFKIAVQLDDSFVPSWGNIGTALMNEGRHQEALLATQRVLALAPDNPTAHMNLGGIYKNLGQLDQALASTLKSLELKPHNPTAHMKLGGIYQDLGQFDHALAATLKSLELKPDNPTAHMNLGGIYKDLGKLDQALTATLKSLELKPDNPDAHMNLGGIYFQKGKLDKARSALEKSLSIEKTSSAMIVLSKVCSELGVKEESLKYAFAAVEIDKNNAKCLINLANQCKICESFEQAIDAGMKAIEINERSEDAYLAVSNILCKQKLFTNARQVLEKAQKNIENSHVLDGELVRVKYLEGLLNIGNDSKEWTDDDDFYYEDCKGSNLIVSFSGNGMRESIPLFIFRGTLKSFTDYDKLYIRDLDRYYYMNGIKNSAPTISGLKNLILRHVRAKQYKTVTTLGVSSGGFGALLYGNLIKADHMIAFNPQTVLNEKQETIIKDDVFATDICKMLRDANRGDQFYHKCLDIRNFIPFKGKAVIHCSNNSHSGIDKRYAEYLQHENCDIVVHESSTHLLALDLKQKNMLISVIAKSINSQGN